MKSIKIFLAAFCTFLAFSTFAQTSQASQTAQSTQAAQTAVFKVYGNCSSCKKHIETAAHVTGVAKADWNKDTKMLTLVYDPSKVTTDDIQKRIAAVGYDTPKYRGDDKAYNKLDECCQYDRKQPK
jgi:copper chaperone CopZ